MSELLDFYQAQVLAQISTIPWLAAIQKKALFDFTHIGFPSRSDEDWKYTLMDSFLKQRFSSHVDVKDRVVESKLPLSTGYCIHLMNGGVSGLASLTASLPLGVLVLPLSEAMLHYPQKVKSYLSQILNQQHAFQTLNTAMLHCGLFVYLPKGVVLKEPLIISHLQDNPKQAVYLRHLVVAEEGSSLTMIEDYDGLPDVSYLTNTVTEISLAQKAVVTHYKIQRDSKTAFHMGHLAVKQVADSQFVSHSFSLGGRIVRSDISIDLTEPGAHCFMNGIYAPGDGQHIDHHTVVTHAAPDCRSEQDYKGILKGHSRAVFNGQVIVAENAAHSEAKQQNKNLLLSANAEIDTKPQLNIMADDVVCTHGATVGQLDEEALFYFATRGIEREQAKRYLVKAFAAENLQRLGHVGLQEWLGSLLSQQLG